MKYIAPILVLMLTIAFGIPASWAGTTSPLIYHKLTAPTCSILTPNIQPPNCIDTGGVFTKPRLCSSANPSVVPPLCSKTDEPWNALTPGETLPVPQLADICDERYEANVPLTSTVLNEVAQQAYVNSHMPFKKAVEPCVGGCTLDALIPLSLGGSNNLANLWPMPDAGTWTTAMKNTLEATLKTRVCNLDVYGYQRVNFSLLTAGTDATSLVGGTTYTATVTIGATPKAVSLLGSDAQTFTTLLAEINKDLAFTAANQTVNVGGAIAGASTTGLANDATVYTASVAIDGTPVAVSITGSLAQTYTTLLSELNTDLGASATAAIVSGNLRITSATSGSLSSVVITDTDLFSSLTTYVALNTPSAGTDLAIATLVPSHSGYQNVLFAAPKLLATATGLANDVTTYTATITIDGVAKAISLSGSAAQTYTTLLSQINTDLAASAVASLNTLGNLQVVSATTGTASTVSIVDSGTNHLFASLANYSSVGPAFSGPLGYIKITATVFADPATVLVANSGANHLFEAPLANFSAIASPVVGHPTKVDIATARGELSGAWKAAYTKYITNQQ